jgi:hypothetical protein
MLICTVQNGEQTRSSADLPPYIAKRRSSRSHRQDPMATLSGLDYIVLAAHNRISTWRYFVNKLLRSLLKAGVYFLEQSDRNTADMADRVKDRVQNLSRRARHAIYGQEGHTIRNAISFAAGIGLGIGVGMLLAPSPGEETRSSIVAKVHDFGDKLRERFSPEVKKPATGTEGM